MGMVYTKEEIDPMCIVSSWVREVKKEDQQKINAWISKYLSQALTASCLFNPVVATSQTRTIQSALSHIPLCYVSESSFVQALAKGIGT